MFFLVSCEFSSLQADLVEHAALDGPRIGCQGAIAQIDADAAVLVGVGLGRVAHVGDLLDGGLLEALAADEELAVVRVGEVGADVVHAGVLALAVGGVHGELGDGDFGLAVDEELDAGPGAHVAVPHGAHGGAGVGGRLGVGPAVAELLAERDFDLGNTGHFEVGLLVGRDFEAVRVRVRDGLRPGKGFGAGCGFSVSFFLFRIHWV